MDALAAGDANIKLALQELAAADEALIANEKKIAEVPETRPDTAKTIPEELLQENLTAQDAPSVQPQGSDSSGTRQGCGALEEGR